MSELAAEYQDFKTYYQQYKNKIYSFMYYRLSGHQAAAEDLTSEVFLKAYEKFDQYNSQFAFSTWIYTIARNTLIDHTRKHKHQTTNLEEAHHVKDPENNKETIIHNLDTQVKTATVKDAIQNLPEIQQECILLKHIEGLKAEEIAKVTSQSPANVRQIISRGLKKLKKQLAHTLTILLIIIIT